MFSVVAAFIAGFVCVFAIEKIGHAVYPPPAGLDISRPETIVEYVKTMPVGALLFVLAAQSAGAFSGGLITGVISVAKFPMAMTYGVLALLLAFFNIYVAPHPYWFIALALLLPIPLSLAGSKVVQMLSAK
jgi:hypothetical protein